MRDLFSKSITAALVGSLMKRARADMQLSQREVAKEMGITQATLSRYELGEHMPDVRDWLVFCELTGMPTDLPRSIKIAESYQKSTSPKRK